MKVFLFTIVWISVLILTGCQSAQKEAKSEERAGKIGFGLRVFANKNETRCRLTFRKTPEIEGIEVEFNGTKLTGREVEGDRVAFNETLPGYEKTTRILLIKDGTQHTFEETVEPLEFQLEEPFTFHRLTANELKLSRVYTEDYELWLGIFDNYLGVFKEIAEFNKAKDAVLIPESTAKRMSVGDAKIRLYNVKMTEQNDDVFAATFDIRYESEIKLKVVK